MNLHPTVNGIWHIGNSVNLRKNRLAMGRVCALIDKSSFEKARGTRDKLVERKAANVLYTLDKQP
jgi:hypothetical protein